MVSARHPEIGLRGLPLSKCRSEGRVSFDSGRPVPRRLSGSGTLGPLPLPPSPLLNNAETNMNLVLTRMDLPTQFP